MDIPYNADISTCECMTYCCSRATINHSQCTMNICNGALTDQFFQKPRLPLYPRIKVNFHARVVNRDFELAFLNWGSIVFLHVYINSKKVKQDCLINCLNSLKIAISNVFIIKHRCDNRCTFFWQLIQSAQALFYPIQFFHYLHHRCIKSSTVFKIYVSRNHKFLL